MRPPALKLGKVIGSADPLISLSSGLPTSLSSGLLKTLLSEKLSDADATFKINQAVSNFKM